MLEKTIIKLLKPGYRLDLEQTRHEYNELASLLYVGVGIIGVLTYFIFPGFNLKYIIAIYIAYCFVMPIYTFVSKDGYPLWLSVLQVPLGLSMITSLQWLFPIDLVYFTSFLYPLVFIFTFHFHSKRFFTVAMILVFSCTAIIIASRQVPYWVLYFITTSGSTLIIGLVVHSAVSKSLHLANYDSLTGLMNRRYWEVTATQLIERAHNKHRPLTFVFLDLDDLKIINDEQGHAAGDDVLRELGQSIQNVCKGYECLGRWGGDEFAIALPNTPQEKAMDIIHELQAGLSHIQVSSGVVVLEDGESLESILNRADRKMYAVKFAKRSVRNKAG